LSSRGRRGSRAAKLAMRLNPTQKKLSRRQRLVKTLGSLVGIKVEKTRAVMPTYVFETEPVVRRPAFDYISLFEVATTSWPLRRAFRAIVQECMRNRWDIKPRFKWKCKNEECSKEFDTTPKDEKCDSCNGDLRKPDPKQEQMFRELLRAPNDEYNFDDFVRSSIFYDLSLDDWYWSFTWLRKPRTKAGLTVLDEDTKKPVYDYTPKMMYVEDSRFVFPIADSWGRLGSTQYFCPVCYDKPEHMGQDVFEDFKGETQEFINEQVCKECGGPLTETAYVQEIGGAIRARWGKNEIIHGSSSRVIPQLFGNSKIITVWTIVQTILAMDGYNWEVFSEGKVGSIIGFPGEDDIEVAARKASIEEEIKKLDTEDIQTGRMMTSKKIRTLMIGIKKGEELKRLSIMEDHKAMQSVEFYRMYIEAICGVYGVTPSFVSIPSTAGRSPRMEIEVQNRTTQDHQSNFADLFNDELLAKFKITDWILVFNAVEERDEFREMQTIHTKLAAALTGLRCNFKVEIDETGELHVIGKGSLPEVGGLGSRASETPRPMEGKPGATVEGAPRTSQGEHFMLTEKGTAGLPISWESLTQIRLGSSVFMLEQDQDEVFISWNATEIQDTRTPILNVGKALSNYLSIVLNWIGTRILSGVEGFNKEDYNVMCDGITQGFRRDFDTTVPMLVMLANYFENLGQANLAEKIDNLRRRWMNLELSRIVPPSQGTTEGSGEMPETALLSSKSKAAKPMAKAPYGITYEEERLADNLNKIVKWAVKQVKGGRTKKSIKAKAKLKAKRLIEKSYEAVHRRGIKHAQIRTKQKNITLSKEQIRRLEDFKAIALRDFVEILGDRLG